MPPIRAGLQWLWMRPTLKAEIFALLEAQILAGKQAPGRTGMDRWQILVLGVVRWGLDAHWDRREHGAHSDALVRPRLGVPAAPWGEDAKVFGQPKGIKAFPSPTGGWAAMAQAAWRVSVSTKASRGRTTGSYLDAGIQGSLRSVG